MILTDISVTFKSPNEFFLKSKRIGESTWRANQESEVSLKLKLSQE